MFGGYMRYIENDGHVTREYGVNINVEQLQKIIDELRERCSRIINSKIKVADSDKDEAIKKINIAINSGKADVNELIEISDACEDTISYSKKMKIFDCNCLCRESSYLEQILQTLLNSYQSSLDYKKQNNHMIDLLIGYENNNELKPYSVRIKECTEKMIDLHSSNCGDMNTFNEMQKELESLLNESHNNPNYDFELLYKLYQMAKSCFRLTLLSQTIHYKDIDKNPDAYVYKLGDRRII